MNSCKALFPAPFPEDIALRLCPKQKEMLYTALYLVAILINGLGLLNAISPGALALSNMALVSVMTFSAIRASDTTELRAFHALIAVSLLFCNALMWFNSIDPSTLGSIHLIHLAVIIVGRGLAATGSST